MRSLILTLLFIALISGAAWAQFRTPQTKWNPSTRCTTLTLGDGTAGPMYCQSPSGKGGYFVLPNCPTDVTLPSGALCQVAGGKGIVGRGSTTPFTAVP